MEDYDFYRWKRWITAAALLTAVLVSVIFYVQERKEVKIQQGIAEEVIRFHVLANSDTQGDQDLKMEVRDVVLEYLTVALEDCKTVGETRGRIIKELGKLEELAVGYVQSRGYDYQVSAELVTDEFPEKIYGDCTFPSGEYEALRIKIGEAQGHNWWCMVYPGLCFTEETGAYVSEENKTMLKHVLTEEEFEVLTKENRIKIRFRLLDLELFDLF